MNNKVKDDVAKMIKSILNTDVNTIDDYDNLVELGVDSILIMEINSRLHKKYGISIQVSQFFNGLNTIADIAQFVSDNYDELHDNMNTTQNKLLENIEKKVGTGGSTTEQKKLSDDIQRIVTETLEMYLEKYVNGSDVVGDTSVTTCEVANNKDFKDEKKVYIPYRPLELKHENHSEKIHKALKDLSNSYNQKTALSKDFAKHSRRYHADCRNVAGFRLDYKEMVYQLLFKSCSGSKIVDIDDNKYIDIAMGFGVDLFGHKPEFIVKAIKEVVEEGFPLSMPSKKVAEVSELLCELTGMERVAYFNSGSEAVMTAMRIARAKTAKKKIVCFAGAYHGTFDGVLGIKGGNEAACIPMTVGIVDSLVEDLIVLDYGTDKSLQFIEEHSSDIAGVLLEAVQSRNPSFQPREFITALRKITKQNGIALIFDEMITGFRISSGGAQEYFGVKGDIATYGKIVGGGMPIGIVAGSAQYMDCLDGGIWEFGDDSVPPNESIRTYTGGTFCHHPMTMAAALAVLSKIKAEKNKLYSSLNRKTQFMADELNKYFHDNKVPIKIANFGSLFRFEFQKDMEAFYYYMHLEGIYIYKSGNCFISTEHTDEDINTIICATKRAVERMSGVFFDANPVNNELELSERQKLMIQSLKYNSYTENVLFKVDRAFEDLVFESSMKKVIDRHGILNMCFSRNENHFRKTEEKFALKRVSIENKTELLELLQEPFDLYSESGLRVYMIEEQEKRYVFIVVHHLLVDGFSLINILYECLGYYNVAMGYRPGLDLKPAICIQEFECIKHNKIQELDKVNLKAFWEEYKQKVRKIELPSIIEGEKNIGKRVSTIFDKVEYMDIKSSSLRYQCSPFILLLSAAHILLNKISGQRKLCLGVPYAEQLLTPEYSVVGYLDKVMPVAIEIMPEFSVKDIVYQNKFIFERFNEYRYCFDEVCTDDDISRPSMNVIFNLDTLPELKINQEYLRVESIKDSQIQYDLFINLTLTDNQLMVDFDYNAAKYSDTQVKMWLDGYRQIVLSLFGEKIPKICNVRCTTEENLISFLVPKRIKGNPEFVNAILVRSHENDSYIIVDAYHKLLPIGTIGIVGIYSSEKILEVTSFCGRINSNNELEIIDHMDNTVYINGLTISKTQIKDALISYEEIEDVTVYTEKDELCVDLTSNCDTAEVSLNKYRKCCIDKLPSFMVPSKYYIVKGGIKKLIISKRLEGLEKEVSELCSDITGINDIGVEEDLLSLGVNSLQLSKLLSEIYSKHKTKISIGKIEGTLSVKSIVKAMMNLSKEETLGNILKVPEARFYNASLAQKRLFIEYQFNKDSLSYNIPAVVDFMDDIDIDKIYQSVKNIVERHEVLRTYFKIHDGEIVQVIRDTINLEFDVIETEINTIDDKYIDNEMRNFIRPFKLEEDVLFRIKILKSLTGQTVMLFDIHHIVFDGYSEGIFLNELLSYLNGKELHNLSIQYKDFSAWQNKMSTSSQNVGQEDYWMNKFSNGIPTCRIEEDINISEYREDETSRGFCNANLNQEISMKLVNMCRKIGCTPSVLMLAAFGYTIRCHLAGDKVMFGVTLDGRNQIETHELIGFFVTNLPFLQEFEEIKSLSVEDYINNVKKEMYDLMDNSDVSLERIVEICGLDRTQNHRNIYDINFTYQDFNEDFSLNGHDIKVKEFLHKRGNIFALDCEIINRTDYFEVIFKYDENQYFPTTMNRLLTHFLNCLQAFINYSDHKLLDICVLDENERNKVLYEFNDNENQQLYSQSIINLFEEQVNNNSSNIALIQGNIKMTYGELSRRTDAIAQYLNNMGIGNHDCIAIMIESSIEFVIGIIGIVKAGGAYVPIDPNYPDERIHYILKDCNPKALLVNKETVIEPYHTVNLKCEDLYCKEQVVVPKDRKRNSLLYIIYTSGTEGNPKGSMIADKSIIRLVKDPEYVKLDSNTILLQASSVSFDASVFEIWGTLLNGGRLVIEEKDKILNPELMKGIIERNKINTMWLTSSLFNYLFSMKEDLFDSLVYLLVGGEKLSDKHIRRFKNRKNSVELINGYGPTENAVFTSTYRIPDDFNKIYIGKPITNTQVYILQNENLCGIDMPGELCTSGDGVSLGYLNKDDLTQEKFIDNPFGNDKLYKTGDLAKWNEDGNIAYLGRIDEQVKIRGFRIELTEIEKRALEVEHIKSCAVVADLNGDNEKTINLYYVADIDLPSKSVRNYLKKVLPAYMLPQYYIQIPNIPLTRNGKVDKKSLPKISSAGIEDEPISNEFEQFIRETFHCVLKMKVGLNDSFFDYGGHSLNAIYVINKLENKYGVRISLKTFFDNPTVKELALFISKSKSKYIEIPKADKQPYYPMSAAQKRLYAISELDNTALSYNMPGVIEFNNGLDIEKMREVIQKLTIRHEILRTSFGISNGNPIQIVNEEPKIDFTLLEADKCQVNKLYEQFLRPFDLSRTPLIRFLVIKLPNNQYNMFVDMHHIISDGLSNNILLKEMVALYNGNKLEPLRIQYSDYSVWMQNRDFSKQKEYWLKEFGTDIPVLDMPLDRTRPLEQKFDGDSISIKMESKLVDKIKDVAIQNNATEFMVVLSALMVLISKYSRQEEIVIGTPVNGRVHPDTESMLGMFVNTLALKGKVEKNITFVEFLQSVKVKCINAFDNQEYPFDEIVESLDVSRDYSRNPLFDVMLAFNNIEDLVLKMGDEEIVVREKLNDIAKFDLTFNVNVIEDSEYEIKLEYSTLLFEKETIRRILDYFIRILEQVTQIPEIQIRDIEAITEADKNTILNVFNKSTMKCEKEKTIVDLFEEQVYKTPNNIAVIYKNKVLTYKQLNEKANTVAYKLRELGVKPNDFVAVIGERCNELIIALFGIFKSGGAYVPINSNYPQERIDYIIQDCNPKAIIVAANDFSILEKNIPILKLIEDEIKLNPENPSRVHKPENYSHCFYTSGTTGNPKGAINLHIGLVNRILWNQIECPINENDVLLQKTTITFDDSLCELLWWSITGARLIMLDNEAEKEPIVMCDFIKQYNVSVMYFVPTVLSFFINTVEKFNLHQNVCSLRYVFVSGEELKPNHVEEFHKAARKMGKEIKMINEYGPTEASIDCTFFNCVHIATSNGRFCGAKRPQCEANRPLQEY